MPHKDLPSYFVMFGACICIILLVAARHHPPSRQKIKEIWHGRVYWENSSEVSMASPDKPEMPDIKTNLRTTSKEPFNDHEPTIEPINFDKDIENIEKKITGPAYFFLYSEPRCHASIPLVIKNAMTNYPFKLLFYFSDENSLCLQNMIENDPFMSNAQEKGLLITVHEETMDSSQPIYDPKSWNNRLYSNENFWKKLKQYGTNAITIQSDTIICSHKWPFPLDKEIDYIGGISKSVKPSSKVSKDHFNGGLSIRNLDWTIKCIQQASALYVEDSLFNKCPRSPITYTEAMSFSSDNGHTACFNSKSGRVCPWGVHKPWVKAKGAEYEELERNCPVLKTLKSLQKKTTVSRHKNLELVPAVTPRKVETTVPIFTNVFIKNTNDLPKNNIQCQKVMNQNEFAIYSYNFGNYRNELSNNEEQLAKIASYGIDAYFFTDNVDFNPPGWHTIHMETDKSQNGIPAPRLTGKRLKFKGHHKLEKYRYLIHVDSFPSRLNLLIKWLKNGLIQFVKTHPTKSFFVGKHRDRLSIQAEVEVLKKIGPSIQPQHQLNVWDKFLMPYYSQLNKIRLPELHTWVRDTHDKTLSQKWASVYDTLIERGLWRDQIVYSYAMKDSIDNVYITDIDENAFRSNCEFPSILTKAQGPKRAISQYEKKQASKLDKHYNDVINWDKRVEFEILKRFNSQNIKAPILCVGARLGGEVRAFKYITKSSDVVGIDFNPGKNNPDVIYGDAMDLQFENDSFQTIYTNILDHIPNIDKAFSEMKRVLKSNGIVLIDIDQNPPDAYAVRNLVKERDVIEALMKTYFGNNLKHNIINDKSVTKDPGKHTYWFTLGTELVTDKEKQVYGKYISSGLNKIYHSSKWEQLWLDNIEEWQETKICEALTKQTEQIYAFMKDTCSASTNTDWCLVDDSVHQVWYNTKNGQTTLRKPFSVTKVSPLKKMTPKNDTIWSYFEFSDGTREYIEPLVSHLRHPLARCLFGDAFLTDRSYVLPGNPGSSKTFLFDAGASHWSQGAGGPSLSYFTSVWKRYGFDWSHIEGWEGGTTVAKFEATVPQEWRSRTHFHQDWISTSPDKQPFVPDVIRSTASKEDYVVFKLDIDSKSVETAIVDYLLAHPEALEYIDEFVWEHHVDNYIMAPNWGNTQDMSKSIADSYQYFLKLRKLGVRAHSWV